MTWKKGCGPRNEVKKRGTDDPMQGKRNPRNDGVNSNKPAAIHSKILQLANHDEKSGIVICKFDSEIKKPNKTLKP